jgi:hypothetical protein
LAYAWGLAGLIVCAVLWRDGGGLDESSTSVAENAVPVLVSAVCLFAATVSFAAGAVLQRMATWQAAEVEAERG